MTAPARPLSPALAGWTPSSLRWDNARAVVEWRFTEGARFHDPFFDQTMERCLQDPFRLLFWRETGIETVVDLARASPATAPDGDHFSPLALRVDAGDPDAGRTGTGPGHVGAGPVDQVARAQRTCAGLARADVVAWLRAIVSVLGQRRHPHQARYILKLDAWAILDWRLVAEAFPATPCIFVYRDPAEVIVSHLGHRGYHMVPGTLTAEQLGLTGPELAALSPEQYCGHVLARLCQAALDAKSGTGMSLVHYDCLPDAVEGLIAPLFGLEIGPAERGTLAAVAGRDAKNPVVAFRPDGAAKAERATPAVHAAVAATVGPAYAALEALRVGPSVPRWAPGAHRRGPAVTGEL